MMKRLVFAIFMVLFWITQVQALCFFEDVECIAPLVLPEYNSDSGSTREWSASSGFMFAFDNVIVARVRFDDQSLSILQSNPNFGLETKQ